MTTLRELYGYFASGRLFIGCDIDPACGALKFDDPRNSVLADDANEESTCARIRQLEGARAESESLRQRNAQLATIISNLEQYAATSKAERSLAEAALQFAGERTVAALGNAAQVERPPSRYSRWVEAHSVITDEMRVRLRSSSERLGHKPLISIIMPTFNPEPRWLIEAVDSVRAQLYPQWELCIADDASTMPGVHEQLSELARSDSRIKLLLREENGHIAVASNSALSLAAGEWAVLLDQDDLLSEDALLRVAEEINRTPDVGLVYSDEDKLDSDGRRCEPYFKPDWSPHLACSHAYLSHMVAFSLRNGKPSFTPEAAGAQDYDLWLSIASRLAPSQIRHIPRILYHWRKHPQSTASNPQSKSYADAAGEQAVQRFVTRRYDGIPVKVERGQWMFFYSLRIGLAEHSTFSIIIPTTDNADALATCIRSIRKNSTWQQFEIIVVNNNSQEQITFDYFRAIQQADRRVKVIDAAVPSNRSRLNNIGAEHARGDFLVFLNPDTAVISEDWLERLGGFARLPDVGLVGALLLYEDGSIQHAGVVVGMGGWADHVYRREKLAHAGGHGFVSPELTRNVLAVTGACMAMSRERFAELGGFDETFVTSGGDVELGLRASRAGYFNVHCAEARLYHFESLTHSPIVPLGDFEQSVLKYAPYRCDKTDPFFNPNLSLHSTTPFLSGAPRAA